MPVTRLGPPERKLSDAQVIAKASQVVKAVSDLGVIGEAMSGAVIATQLGSSGRSWQQKLLADAAIHWWLYRKNPWIRTCVDLIAQRATADDYSVDSLSGSKSGIQALEQVLLKINPKQSFKRMLRGVYRDRQINGNWYGRVQFADGVPVALYRIDFRTIAPVPVDVGFPQWYSIYKNGRNDVTPIQIPAEEIIHLTLNDGGENGCGLSPMESLDYTLALDTAAITFNQGFLSNGAKAGDIYGMDPTMTPEQVDREREQLVENFTKPSQAYSPLFVQGIELIRDGAQIRKDMDFVLLRKWDREECLAVYSVPGSLVTMEIGALGANGKEADSDMFDEMVIAPEQKAVFEDFNRELMQERFRNTDLVLIPPKIAGVRLDLVNTAGNMLKAGATGNESRRTMRLDDIDKGYDKPIWQFGPSITVIGEPGSPDSIILTPKGAFKGDPQDPGAAAAGDGDGEAGGNPDGGTGGDPDAKTTAARKKVQKADPITPAIGTRPDPSNGVTYSQKDRQAILDVFEDAFPEFAGLLDAKVTSGQ